MSPRIEVDSDIRTSRGLKVPASALHWSFSRSSGAGGQHVNKIASRATLTVSTSDILGSEELIGRVRALCGPTIVVVSQVSRSQWQNRQVCRARLVDILDEASAPPTPPRRATKPTRGAVERRLAGKRLTSSKKAGRRGEGW